MPRIPKIYLETRMFNFPFTDAAPQYRADTLRLFVEINNPRTRFAGEASGRGMLFL